MTNFSHGRITLIATCALAIQLSCSQKEPNLLALDAQAGDGSDAALQGNESARDAEVADSALDASLDRSPSPAPAQLEPGDWIPFLCEDCTDTIGRNLRAVRCDGSKEIFFDLPFPDAKLTGATFTHDFVIVTTEAETGWETYVRNNAAEWSRFQFGPGPAGPHRMGSPQVVAHFSLLTRVPNVVVYNRSWLSSEDTEPSLHSATGVSFMDLDQGTWFDYFGVSILGPVDTDIAFGVLPTSAIARYFHYPSGERDDEGLDVWYPRTGSSGPRIPMNAPTYLAGLRTGEIAALVDGQVTLFDSVTGRMARSITWPHAIQGIFALDQGGLAFAADGELYCEKHPDQVVRLTSTTTTETLFTR